LGTKGTRAKSGAEDFANEKVEAMSPDDYTSDPSPDTSGVPGTADDVSNGYGEEAQSLGGSQQAELWRRQKPLIEEDEKEGLKLAGFADTDIPDILEAMGDDASDPLDDAPNGTSATGLWGTPDHGGFPPRSD
jgi:hypothetical protein